MKVIVLQRQSIADIAIQVYGDIRGALEIAIANNMSVTTVLEAGTEIDCPDTTFSPYIQEYVKRNRISPATELSDQDEVSARIFTEQFTKEYI